MKKIFCLICFCFLGACAQFEPFVDARREAGQVVPVGSSRPEAPVVCSGLFTEQIERQALADKECEKIGKKAVSESVSSFDCKLFLPVKERFICVSE